MAADPAIQRALRQIAEESSVAEAPQPDDQIAQDGQGRERGGRVDAVFFPTIASYENLSTSHHRCADVYVCTHGYFTTTGSITLNSGAGSDPGGGVGVGVSSGMGVASGGNWLSSAQAENSEVLPSGSVAVAVR